ncbi:MAG: hypothetical protein QOG61_1791, partial [Candidatus Binataceae bacterium]|nr:hypothetical protein [Candidatus Binataceae bacterium]
LHPVSRHHATRGLEDLADPKLFNYFFFGHKTERSVN